MESSLTIKFRGAEAELLDRLVRSGLFATESEAIRAALVKYGADLGLLRAKDPWSAIKERAPKAPGVRCPTSKGRPEGRGCRVGSNSSGGRMQVLSPQSVPSAFLTWSRPIRTSMSFPSAGRPGIPSRTWRASPAR